MRERPLLMSGEMVRAILDGTKSQTRRVVSDATSQGNWKASELDLSAAWVDPGPSPAGNPGPYLKASPTLAAMTAKWDDAEMAQCELGHLTDRLYPKWFPGDRLWVRETWQLLSLDHDWETGYVDGWEAWEGKVPPHRPTGYITAFANEEGWGSNREERGFAWRPSIFMPRWASRLTLEITDVRVERLQDISEADAKAEGVEQASDPDDCTADDGALNAECGYFPPRSYVDGYRQLWDDLNASRGYGWDVNPWVFVLSFRRIDASRVDPALAVDFSRSNPEQAGAA